MGVTLTAWWSSSQIYNMANDGRKPDTCSALVCHRCRYWQPWFDYSCIGAPRRRRVQLARRGLSWQRAMCWTSSSRVWARTMVAGWKVIQTWAVLRVLLSSLGTCQLAFSRTIGCLLSYKWLGRPIATVLRRAISRAHWVYRRPWTMVITSDALKRVRLLFQKMRKGTDLSLSAGSLCILVTFFQMLPEFIAFS